MGYFECVCLSARLSVDSYATRPYPRKALPRPPPLTIHKDLLQATGLLYLPEMVLWLDWGGRLSVSFYFGPVACERDLYCYCCAGILSVSSDLSEVDGIVIVISCLSTETVE